MKFFSRRYQTLPGYAYCLACEWIDSGTSRGKTRAVEAEATAHVIETGHEVRSVTSRHAIFTPQEGTR